MEKYMEKYMGKTYLCKRVTVQVTFHTAARHLLAGCLRI